MNIFPHKIIVILFLGLFHFGFSQNGKAKIFKNYNVQAAGFIHELNATKDTLILKSDKKINYLYTANNKQEGKVKVRVDNTEYKLPLNRLKKGRNVMVAIQSPLKIVFVINIMKEFPKPFDKALTSFVD